MQNRSGRTGTVWARYALSICVLVAVAAPTLAAMTPWSPSVVLVAEPQGPAPMTSIAIINPVDTYLNLDAVNYSTSTTLNTYTWPDGKVANAILMTFDLSSLPAGAVVERAELNLSLVQSDAVTTEGYGVSVHKVTGPAPVITEATGLRASAEAAWTSSTCCYNNTPLAQADLSAPYATEILDTKPGVKVWTITGLIQEWMANPASNRGLVLNSDPTKPRDRYRTFASMENANANSRPFLRITYSAADVTPPAASISAPAAGATVSGVVPVAVNATDNVGVTGVQISLDGKALGAEGTNAPHSVSWDTRTASDGVHVLTAVARDAAGNRGDAAALSVIVLNGMLVLQPQDTYLNLDAENYSTEQTLGLYTWPDNKPANAIVMKFDLSALPARAVIQQATLSLAQLQSDAVADTYSVRAQKIVGINPDIEKATGMTADGTNGWTANVCCSNNVPLAQADLTPPYDIQLLNPAAGWKSWSITAMAQEWKKDPASNFGVVLNADALAPRDRYRFFASMENPDPALRPYLKLIYSTDSTGDVVPPGVSIAAPAAGAIVTGVTTIAADATGMPGVAGVQFMVDGAPIGAEVTAAPFSIAWDTGAVSGGDHLLTVVAHDATGRVITSAPLTVHVMKDTARPNVSIAAPSPRTRVSGIVTLRANATDNIGVAGVQFRIDGNPVGPEVTESPYELAWNSAEAGNGSHALSAVARDAAGNTRTSSNVTITTSNDRTQPSVSITSPTSGSNVFGSVTVRANASDNVGVAGVRFQVDGVNIGAEDTTSSYSVVWDSALASPGAHTLTAIARDVAGNTRTSAAVNVTLAVPDTTPPVISSVAVSGITTSTATIAWTTNESSNSQLDYGPTSAYGSLNALVSSMVTSHSMTLSGLTAGTTYHARARSRDAADNLSVSGDVTFTTASVPPPAGGGGSGIAALFPGDVNIESHPDVVFVERFDESSMTALFNRWNDILNGSSMSIGADAPAGGNGKSLTIPWQGGGANNGGHLYRQLTTPVTDTLYVRYYIKYPTSGLYQHSGIWMGGHNPAVSFPDPKAGIKPAGDDRFSAAAEQDAATGRFDHYDYWTGMRLSSDGNYWGNKLLNNDSVSVTPGQWMCVEQMVKLNNPVSASNGEHALWLNGVKVSHLGQGFPNGTWSGGNFIQGSGSAFPGFQWRTDANLNINWLWLQVYAPNDPSGFQGQMKFAQVVAARSPIGCMAGGAPVGGGGGGTLDTTAPAVSISAPASGATLTGQVTVTASASDNVGVAGVQFKLDGANLGAEDTASPYSIGWDATTASSGAHVLTAVARDAAGNVTTSAGRSVTVAIPPPPPPPPPTSGAVLFDSTWDTASGTSNGAVTDGGRWPNYWEFNGNNPSVQLMSVVSGGPGGHNALRVQQRGSSFAANVQIDNVVPQSKDYYLRFYMKNDDTSGSGDHIVTVDTWQYANLTFLRKTSSSSGWSFVASMYGCGYTYPIGHWGPTESLARGQWYRFEYFVHFVDPTHIQLHPRVSDANGNLLFSDAEFKQTDFGGASWNGRSDWSFASYYAAGNSFCVDPSFVNDIGFGNNGQFGAADTGQYWYFSGVQVRTDTWPGPMPSLSADASRASSHESSIVWAMLTGSVPLRRDGRRRGKRSMRG